MNSNNYSNNPWFYIPTKCSYVSSRLFCLHHAGSNARFFESWIDLLPQGIQLIAIQLPGRPPRDNEPCITDMNILTSHLVDAIMPLLDKPYISFGHSLGGVISYEVLKALRWRNAVLPSCFAVSACRAPNIVVSSPSSLSKVKSIKSFSELFYTDISLLKTWNYQTEEAFNIPFLACGGVYDLLNQPSDIIEWRSHTKAEFSAHFYKGGHDYLLDYKDKVIHNLLPYFIL